MTETAIIPAPRNARSFPAGLRRLLKQRRGLLIFLLVAPAVAILVATFLLPVTILASVSFMEQDARGNILPVLTLANYVAFFSDPWFVATLARSARIAFFVALLSVTLGYACAYYLVFLRPKLFEVYLVLVVAPILVGNVVRAFGWRMLLGDSGLIKTGLAQIGFPEHAIRFMNTEHGIIIADTSTLLPLVILILIGVLSRIDHSLVEAAKVLGANNARAFLNVTLPLSFAGIGAASVICFTLALGTFEVAVLVGGKRVQMIAPLVYEQITYAFNWPMAATVSVVLLVASVCGIALHDYIFARRMT